MAEDRNCLSYWYPKLQASGVLTPRTEIVRTDVDLWPLLDGEKPEGFDELAAELKEVAGKVGGFPVFLRSGHTSGKHDWKDTCYVEAASEMASHIVNIFEYGECTSLMGLPTDVWAVREMIPTIPQFVAFHGGMPITQERRYFFADGMVCCRHPYWPDVAFAHQSCSTESWRAALRVMNVETRLEIVMLSELTEQVAAHFDGAWSLDWLLGADGRYWARDMATAETSWHWPGCPVAKDRGWGMEETE